MPDRLAADAVGERFRSCDARAMRAETRTDGASAETPENTR